MLGGEIKQVLKLIKKGEIIVAFWVRPRYPPASRRNITPRYPATRSVWW
jgi:hypothetical protein